MISHRMVIALCVVLVGRAAAEAAEVTFAAKPTVKAMAEGVQVSFAASAPTDVEVAVLDAQGRVVRHLAAGMLGDKVPAPLKKGALEQTLV